MIDDLRKKQPCEAVSWSDPSLMITEKSLTGSTIAAHLLLKAITDILFATVIVVMVVAWKGFRTHPLKGV